MLLLQGQMHTEFLTITDDKDVATSVFALIISRVVMVVGDIVELARS